MNRPFLRYFLSPLATLLTLAMVHLVTRYDLVTVSLALPVGVLALCLFWSGLRANILSAVFITAYALYSSHYDPSRAGQVIFTVWPVAVFGGLLKRWLIESVKETEWQRLRAAENQAKADFVDNLNGNIETIKEINQELIELYNAIPILGKVDIQMNLNRIQGKAANLAQRVVGWHQIAQEKKDFLAGKK